MTDRLLKERIAKLYSSITKISLVLAPVVIILSLTQGLVFSNGLELDRHAALIAVFLLVATPFTGVFIALVYYLSSKNRAMIFYSSAIILVLIVGIFLRSH